MFNPFNSDTFSTAIDQCQKLTLRIIKQNFRKFLYRGICTKCYKISRGWSEDKKEPHGVEKNAP